MPESLNQNGLLKAVDDLTAKDHDLAMITSMYGPPPLWQREPGFPTIIHIILEQQVSLASAKAAFNKLKAAADPLSPSTFLALSNARSLTSATAKPGGKAKHFCVEAKIMSQPIFAGKVLSPAIAETLSIASITFW